MRPSSVLAILATTCGLAAACGSDIDPPEPGRRTIAPATFASVVAELSLARAELLPDTAAYRVRMGQILARHRVTPAELRAFAAGYGANEDVIAGAYRLERARFDSLYGSGPVPSTGMAGVAPPVDVVAPADTAAAADTVPVALPPAPLVPAPAAPADTTAAPAPGDTTPALAPSDTTSASRSTVESFDAAGRDGNGRSGETPRRRRLPRSEAPFL